MKCGQVKCGHVCNLGCAPSFLCNPLTFSSTGNLLPRPPCPVRYISITAGYTPEWERWWKSPEDVEMVQFMGKDNVPFHTVIFPATLLGTGDKWTMMKNIRCEHRGVDNEEHQV